MTSLLFLSELKNNGLKLSDLQDVQYLFLGALLPLNHINLTWVYADPAEKGQFDFLIQAGGALLLCSSRRNYKLNPQRRHFW